MLYNFEVWDDVNRFAHAFTLSGKDCLINAEAAGRDREQSAVGRNSITNSDGDDIAWDKLGGVNADNLTSSEDLRFVGRVLLESLGHRRSR